MTQVKEKSKVTSESPEIIEIKPYKLRELCQLYNNVDPETFRSWLKPFQDEIGPRKGHYYTIKQVKIIFAKLDLPSKIVVS